MVIHRFLVSVSIFYEYLAARVLSLNEQREFRWIGRVQGEICRLKGGHTSEFEKSLPYMVAEMQEAGFFVRKVL
jgi:hypothetical protein